MTDITRLRALKGLKFCHINVRSISNKIDQFKLHFENSGIDVITVSETWLTKDICNSILYMEDYQMFRLDRSHTNGNGIPKKGGGLMIYVKKGSNLTPISDEALKLSDPNCELQRLELCSEVQKNILLYNIYSPPAGNVETFTELISDSIEGEIRLGDKELILLGDFNINYLAKRAPDTKKLVGMQNKFGLTQQIKSHTRSSKTSRTMIDLIMTNMDYCTSAGVINLHISDHQPVYVIKKKPRDTRGKVDFRGRSYMGYSRELLSDYLTNAVKESLRNTLDPNECWELMENSLVAFLDIHCPVKTFRSKEKKKPWISHEIITLSKDRDRAWELARETNSEADWEIARRLRNWASNAVKAAKANYMREELDNNKNDPKKFWRNIKNVLPDQNNSCIDIKNPLTQENVLKDRQAQIVNDFFAGIGPRLSSKFGNNVALPPLNDVPDNPFELDHIGQPEVLKLIGTISVNKSSGIDNVSSRILKDFLTLVSRELTLLYNNIIDTGIFPDKWKIATVTPIPKTTCAVNPTDLRPISLLPIPGKLLEKYITTNLEGNKFFTENQNGFRKGKSTAGAMTKFLDDVICDLNDSKVCIAAFLDVQKAFDTINHKILLYKLRSSGIGVKLCGLLQNYLENRQQKTKLYNGVSALKPVTIGVPQGSTIGPVMFIMYINDLFDVLDHATPLMYADDTVLYCCDLNNKLVRKKMQKDLNNVEKWCQENRLTLNVSKTKIMTFMSDHKRKTKPDFRLFMRGNIIEEVGTYKYLGTTLDNRLSGDAQYTKTMQMLGLKLKTFGKIRRFLNENAALTVYRSTILPLIDYNDSYQMLWSAVKLRKLQKLQNWGLRIVYHDRLPKLSEDELHREAGLLMLKRRRILHLLSIMYRRSKSELLLDLREIHTRQFDKVKFKVINPVISKAFKAPNYLGAQLWDLLPKETQTSATFSAFKYRVKTHLNAGIFNVF